MIGKDDIFQVKREIDNYVGSKVRIRANKGRKKIVIKEGVIQSTYPWNFIIRLNDESQKATRVVSYSYTDILTHTVELSLCQDS
jgi:uncharacterized protein Veg